MQVHLVAGFLGSGKTTAIVQACKELKEQGITVGVITNDQGKTLVDSKMMKSEGIPFAEVTGGCFCCKYDRLDEQIHTLKYSINPEHIFAETVGSCTDLMATVVRPLLKYRKEEIENLSFSTLVDAALFLESLEEKPSPFHEETSYIWLKQIEESGTLIVNKSDLLSLVELNRLKQLAEKTYPSKLLIFQNSLDPGSIQDWINTLTRRNDLKDLRSVDIDYEIYGAGEANLAWLDEEIEITTNDDSALRIAHKLINRLTHAINMNGLPIGHLKFLLNFNGQSVKLSFTTILNRNLITASPPELCNTVHLLINARIQTSPEVLSSMVKDIVHQLRSEPGIRILEKNLACFKPGFPQPAYRMK